jgi:hypothetical protein
MPFKGEAKRKYQKAYNMREYMRQYRAGKAGKIKVERGLAEDVEPLKARIRELEIEVKRLELDVALWASSGRPQPLPRTAAELREWSKLQKQKKAKQAAVKAAKIEKTAAELAQQGEVTVETLTERVASQKAQLTAARTRIRNLEAHLHMATMRANDRVRMVLPKGLRKRVLRYLHPDSAPHADAKTKSAMNETCQEFSGLNFKEEP